MSSSGRRARGAILFLVLHLANLPRNSAGDWKAMPRPDLMIDKNTRDIVGEILELRKAAAMGELQPHELKNLERQF